MMLLEGRDMTAQYGRIKALHDIAFDIPSGELVAFIGANGAGKTTLLRVLSGVLPLASGRIRFDGASLAPKPSHQRVAMGIIQVPEGRQVFGPMTVEDNLRLGAYRRRGSPGDLERIFALFPILADKRDAPALSLSGGQQQLLAIGRAMMGNPRLLLLDEPSMGLAPLAVRQIYDVIRLLREEGMTICLVEQNARAALAVADRAYVMESGVIVLGGRAADIANDAAVRRAYLAH